MNFIASAKIHDFVTCVEVDKYNQSTIPCIRAGSQTIFSGLTGATFFIYDNSSQEFADAWRLDMQFPQQ